jgi:hypothetical protein
MYGTAPDPREKMEKRMNTKQQQERLKDGSTPS